MPKELTFVIGPADEFPSFGLLSKALEDIRRLLRDVDDAVYGPGRRREWRLVSLHSSAPTITVAPDRENTEAVGVVGVGLQLVTKGTDLPPDRFTEPVLKDLKRLKRLYRGKGRAESIAVLMDGEEMAAIRSDIAEKVDLVLSSGYHTLGSVQGKLDAINLHVSRTATIWDRVSGSPVRWTFPSEALDQVKDLLGRPVLVAGNIRYFANGAPRSISNVVAFEEETPAEHDVKARFGSIPDRRVQELGVTEWLQSIREVGRA